MEIRERRVGQTLVLDINGQIKGADVAECKATFRRLIQKGELDLVANLANVGFIDSSGVGMLIHGLQEIRSSGGNLRLMHLSEDIHDLFEMVAIDRLFVILQDESEIVPIVPADK
jgi:anti-sigma B factor antagonist